MEKIESRDFLLIVLWICATILLCFDKIPVQALWIPSGFTLWRMQDIF